MSAEWTTRSPVIRIANEAGLRFGLNEDEFARWWQSVHPEDSESFLYHGGDELLARFVCCFDYFTGQGKRGAIVAAYAVAIAADPNDREVQTRAEAAWEHAAVRDLLDRLNYRELRMATTRISRKYVAALEEQLDKADLPPDERLKVIDLAGKFVRQTQEQEEKQRSRRDRRARLSPGASKKLSDGEHEQIEQYAEVLGKLMKPVLETGKESS